MWPSQQLNSWTGVFQKIGNTLQKSSGVLFLPLINSRMYSVSCHPLNKIYVRKKRARPTPVPKTKVCKNNLLERERTSLNLRLYIIENSDGNFEMFVRVYLLEGYLVNMEWDHLERQSQGSLDLTRAWNGVPLDFFPYGCVMISS